jgi:hypothetical protein
MERLDEDGGECCQTKLANRTISHQGVPDAEVKWRGRRPCDDTLDRIFNHQGFRRVARRWGAVALVVMLVANSSMGVKALGEAGCGTFYQDQSCREDCGSCGQLHASTRFSTLQFCGRKRYTILLGRSNPRIAARCKGFINTPLYVQVSRAVRLNSS